MVKIEQVTAEIFLIWTYVARTNVAWTNVTVIGSRGSEVPTFKVWSTAEIFGGGFFLFLLFFLLLLGQG